MYKKSNAILTHIALLLILFSNSAAINAMEKSPRIIGGTLSPSDAWPWMAGLVETNASVFDSLFCGASLIAKDWVLTAAHCVINETSSSIEVVINHAQINSDAGERLAVDMIVTHPLYDNATFYNDIALIKLHTPSQIAPIKVLSPHTTQDSAGKPAIALGWGSMSASTQRFPLNLQQVDLPLISNEQCLTAMYDISPDMLCAGDALGLRDTCSGDSGGPLIIFDNESHSWRQAGITSWGDGCALPNTYGVYTRIKNYAAFISEHVCTTTEAPALASLNLNIDGNIVRTDWRAIGAVSGYRFNYAPYPQAEPIYSFDTNQGTEFTATLNNGSAFYVAISTYNGNCLSTYSNIEHFTIN